MIRLESRDLKLVECIASTGSITAAASQLHITQSAVSQRLAKVQLKTTLPLFERRKGQMIATAAGEALAAASSRVHAELESVQQRLERLASDRRQKMRITTQCHTLYRWLPFVLRDLHRMHPNLNADVVPEATDCAYEALARDEVDIALTNHSQPEYHFREHPLFTDEFYAVMSKDHPLAHRKIFSPSDFENQSLVLYGPGRYFIVEEVLAPAGVNPGRVIPLRMTEAIVELVRAGAGIAILTGWVFNDIDQAGLVRVRIGRSGMKRQWRAVINPHCPDELARDFTEAVKHTASMLANGSWRAMLRRESETC